tara:strand:+ start:423 stop:635 length:213 start_codon:yes stop_codon:yes gene_type:complete
MTEAEQKFLNKVEDTLLNHTGDTETVKYLIDDMRAEKETVGGSLVAICWAVLVDSGFYGAANEVQSWSVE